MAPSPVMWCACCEDGRSSSMVDIVIEESRRPIDNGQELIASTEAEREQSRLRTSSYVVTPGEDSDERSPPTSADSRKPGPSGDSKAKSGDSRKAKATLMEVSILITEEEAEPETEPASQGDSKGKDHMPAPRGSMDSTATGVRRFKTLRPSSSSSVSPQANSARSSYMVLQGLGLDLSTRRRSSVHTTQDDKILDNYEFADVLGQGGFGSVHKCTQIKDGRPVAIKCIKATATNPAVFEAELDQARRLRHPNIVRLLEAYRDTKMFYLVMELCTGGDLLSLVTTQGLRRKDEFTMTVGLEDDIIGEYAWQMLSGIAYLHYHYIAHRDIKCENYMKFTSHEDSPLKLIDLGLSAVCPPGKKMQEVVGTLTTIAPEVYKRSYTQKCDVWSIGVTLYICAVCMEPWVSESGLSYMDEVRIQRCLEDERWEVPYDRRRWDLKSKDVLELVQSLLVRDPEKRPRAQDVLLKNEFLKDVHRSKQCCGGCLG